ncbi:uncharacterized protein LOC116301063 [Actinia tenebrosa]|uniref:Uncharacterized protein LOC116301063 n=1 Tax=Actinia tenebrosa TaxID=6105 RepID=A0A6P8IGX9_ACTTE|nr:uncharacterized protein LOC116301063 [Actinia tenebrosa]
MAVLKIACALVVLMFLTDYFPTQAVECNFSVGNKKGATSPDWEQGFKGSSASGLRNCEGKCASTCERKDGCKAVDAHITKTFFGGPICNCYGYNNHPELKEAQFWGHRSCS